jgi:hypothetical protein
MLSGILLDNKAFSEISGTLLDNAGSRGIICQFAG